MDRISKCVCVGMTQQVKEAARHYRQPGRGYSKDVIRMVLAKSKARLPPRVLHGKHVINQRALAAMLGNANDRTLVTRVLEGDAEGELTQFIGFCQNCLTEITNKKKRETPEEIKARHQSEIRAVFQRHHEVEDANVEVWIEPAGFGLAQNVEYPKTVFSATLTLVNKTMKPFVVSRPSRCPIDDYCGRVAEYQSKGALWSRIKNRNFLEDIYDTKRFRDESACRAFEEEVRQKYSQVKNIRQEYLRVRLFTSADVGESQRERFRNSYRNSNCYYCEVKTVVLGNDGSEIIMHAYSGENGQWN